MNTDHIEWGDECLGSDVKRQQQEERKTRIRVQNMHSEQVQCSGCGTWFYDTPGNYCTFCADYNGP